MLLFFIIKFLFNNYIELIVNFEKKHVFFNFACSPAIGHQLLLVGLNNIYSDKVHDIHKYNVKIVGSDSKPVAYLDHLLDML